MTSKIDATWKWMNETLDVINCNYTLKPPIFMFLVTCKNFKAEMRIKRRRNGTDDGMFDLSFFIFLSIHWIIIKPLLIIKSNLLIHSHKWKGMNRRGRNKSCWHPSSYHFHLKFIILTMKKWDVQILRREAFNLKTSSFLHKLLHFNTQVCHRYSSSPLLISFLNSNQL